MITGDISIKKKRVMSYFIEAAAEAMMNEGVDQLTIRSVSKIAGYNSATMYHYFENLDELKKWGAIYCITNYFTECCSILEKRADSLYTLVEIWLTYCRYAFHNPQLYSYIFFSPQSASIQQNLKQYSRIFPGWVKHDLHDERIARFITSPTTYDRCMYLVELCVKEGYFKEEDQEDINTVAGILTAGLQQTLYVQGKLVDEEMIQLALLDFRTFFNEYINIKLLKKPAINNL